jgi:hypothetical protein
MRWQNKMKILIENVLNYGLPERRYFCRFHGNNSFYVVERNEGVENGIGMIETSDDLASHWRMHATNFITQVIQSRINEQFNNSLHAV